MGRYGMLVTGSAGLLAALLFSKKDQFTLTAAATEHDPAQSHKGHSHHREQGGHHLHMPSQQKWDFNWDKMAPSKSAEENKEVVKPKASRTLILIRHGQYIWDPDYPEKRILTELGKKQAAVTGRRLKELGYSYDMLHFSTMPRATETAQIIMQSLAGVETRSCELMREGAPIRPEPPHKSWKPETYEFFRDGARIEAAFRKYFHRAPPTQKEDTIEILVCHANVIRYFVCRALQLPPEAWLRISLANGSMTKVVCRPNGTVTLKQLGSSGHMPPDMVTFS